LRASSRPQIAIAFSAAGVVIAGYLTAVRFAGSLPACGPVHGCETVALSTYSEIAGLPVALLGLLFSSLILVLELMWWRRNARQALLAAYSLGLFGVVFVAYLTWLELFVIDAICVWCVAYAVTVVGGWLVAALSVRRV
jgi:uncharacterized membrane protein